MAHGITNEDIIIAATRTWHGLERLTGRLMTIDEALKEAEMLWDVRMEPAFYRGAVNPQTGKAHPIEVPNCKLAVRQDTRAVLGIHTDRYTAYQYHAFARIVADLLVTKDREAVVDTLGTLFGGRQMFMSCATPEPFRVLGDEFTQHFLGVASHDGSRPVAAGFSQVRTVCNNTLSYNLRHGIGHNPFKGVRHVGDMDKTMKQRSKMWKEMIEIRRALQKKAEELVAIKFTTSQVDDMVCELNPMPDPSEYTREQKKLLEKHKRTVDEQRSQFWRAIQADDLANFINTGWGMVQAATYLSSHSEPSRKVSGWRDRRLMENVTGSQLVRDVTKLVYSKA